MTDAFGRRRYGEALAAMGTVEQSVHMAGIPAMQQVYRATETLSFDVGAIHVGCVTFIIATIPAVIALAIAFFLPAFPRNVDQLEEGKLLHNAEHQNHACNEPDAEAVDGPT